MLNIKKFKMVPILGFALMAFCLPGKAQAADLDIFNVISEPYAPNILLVMDTSGSMAEYDAGGGFSRLQAMKEAVIKVVTDNPKVRWGLMTFPYGNNESGRLRAECKDRTEDELKTELISIVRGLSASGGTPVSSALAEAGLYFAGKPSFFWSGTTYRSPIDNVCRNNFIILLTDGFSSVDSGVKGGYNSSGTDRFNMQSKNTIFLRPYMDGRVIGDYITVKTNHPDPAQRVNLGSQISHITNQTYWTSDMNSGIYGTAMPYTSDSNPDWSRTLAGNPLALGNYLSDSDFLNLRNSKKPYNFGYNANDPSRPIPPIYYARSTATRTYVYLKRQGYLAGTQIFQHNITGAGYFASDYLDDVAAFLNNEDLLLTMDGGIKYPQYKKQNVKTFTIGFRFSSDLLRRAAIMGGTGESGYKTADNFTELGNVFSDILVNIKESMSVFSAPAVPSSGENEVYSGDEMYIGMFEPKTNEPWLGNLKRYSLDEDHSMKGWLNENGVINSESISDWSTVQDGNNIEVGGAAARLKIVLDAMKVASPGTEKSLRLVGTYFVENGNKYNILHQHNQIVKGSPKITPSMLGVADDVADADAKMNEIITGIRMSPFGAVIHSTPIAVKYPTKKMVFVGANDGFLHAIDDATGDEKWVFIMPEHLKTIQFAKTQSPNDGVYFVDGPVVAKTVGSNKVLLAGARRGGYTYSALDIANDADPTFMYQIPSLTEHGDWSGYNLGFSWGEPKFVNTHTGVTMGGEKTGTPACVSEYQATFAGNATAGNATHVLIPGGYDQRYDTLAPSTLTNVKGATIVGINAITGKPDTIFSGLKTNASGLMKHSIVDIDASDMNSDFFVDTLYYGDLGGNIFYSIPYNVSNGVSCGDGKTTKIYKPQNDFVPYLLFVSAANAGGSTDGRKFMYAPTIIQESGGEYIYFGSGDRESPLDEIVRNRFYCVKNIDKSRLAATTSDTNYLTEADLVDVSGNELQTSDSDSEKETIKQNLQDSLGWYMILRKSEKVVGKPVVYDGTVYFTTFTPIFEPSDNPCGVNGSSGEARMYIVDYLYGTSTNDLNDDGQVDGSDRDMIIGNSIPSAPVLAIYPDSVKIFVLVNGDDGIKVIEFDHQGALADGGVFFWREIF